MNKISINLNFSGAVLPVVDHEDGYQRVPLKPICDVIGVDWERQRKKVQTPYLTRRLGTCTQQMYWAGQEREMVVIRFDRVAAYLNTINPESVRGAGNEEAADFLERKHQEWDDLIHAYELHRGDLINGRSVKEALAIARIERMQDPILKRLALAKIGIDYDSGKPVAADGTGDLFACG